MLLSVHELELREVPFDVTFRPGSVDLADTEFRQVTAIVMAGVARLVEATGEIQVAGRISGTLEGDCDRCLDRALWELDREFSLSYRPAWRDADSPELELDEEESQAGYYEGSGLQLAQVLTEQILLWLPMHWICSAECKGICPVCGINRNTDSCECRQELEDGRWEALRSFRPSTRP